MLVLSRQRDERLVIVVPPATEPTIIEVAIVDIRGDKVRQGIEAPKHVQVDRKEIYEAKRRDKIQSLTPQQ